MTNPNRFYVYAYLREDGTPYYIGKGCGDRIDHRHGTPGQYWKPPVKPLRVKLAWGMTEPEALRFEVQLISHYGLAKDGGVLTKNFNEGGGKGNTGWVPSEETRANWSKIRTGRKASVETKAKMSAAHTGRPGTVHTEETKAQISKSLKGIVHSEESNHARSATLTGKAKTAEHVAKVSAALKGRVVPEGEVMKMRMAKSAKSAAKYQIPVCVMCSASNTVRARFRRAFAKGLTGMELLQAAA